MLSLIKYLENPLEFYKDPVYSPEEKRDIKRFEKLAIKFYNALKKDKYIPMQISSQEKRDDRTVVRFTKTTIDISNKLVRIDEFNAEEAWFILLSLYCWWWEMIKNLLLNVATRIHKDLKGKKFKSFMTMYPFMNIMNDYKNGKFSALFSDIDVDLRNSFIHGDFNFVDDEIEYYDIRRGKKKLKLKNFISKYKKLAPLYATLYLYRTKTFAEEIREIARKKGFLS